MATSTGEGNPWLGKTLQDFVVYCCPECSFNSRSQGTFLQHAEQHTLAEAFMLAQTAVKREQDQDDDAAGNSSGHAILTPERCLAEWTSLQRCVGKTDNFGAQDFQAYWDFLRFRRCLSEDKARLAFRSLSQFCLGMHGVRLEDKYPGLAMFQRSGNDPDNQYVAHFKDHTGMAAGFTESDFIAFLNHLLDDNKAALSLTKYIPALRRMQGEADSTFPPELEHSIVNCCLKTPVLMDLDHRGPAWTTKALEEWEAFNAYSGKDTEFTENDFVHYLFMLVDVRDCTRLGVQYAFDKLDQYYYTISMKSLYEEHPAVVSYVRNVGNIQTDFYDMSSKVCQSFKYYINKDKCRDFTDEDFHSYICHCVANCHWTNYQIADFLALIGHGYVKECRVFLFIAFPQLKLYLSQDKGSGDEAEDTPMVAFKVAQA